MDADYTKRPSDDILNIQHVPFLWDELRKLQVIVEAQYTRIEYLEEEVSDIRRDMFKN